MGLDEKAIEGRQQVAVPSGYKDGKPVRFRLTWKSVSDSSNRTPNPKEARPPDSTEADW